MDMINNSPHYKEAVPETGLVTSTKEFKREIDNFVQFKLEGVIGKLNLVSRDEFEIQKKIIKNLQREIKKSKKKKN